MAGDWNYTAGGYYESTITFDPRYNPQINFINTDYASGTITFTNPERQIVALKPEQYAVVDMENRNIVDVADTESEADDKAAGLAGRNDRRYVVLKPISLHEPKKETVRRAIKAK